MDQGRVRSRVIYAEGEATSEGLARFREQQAKIVPRRTQEARPVEAVVVCGINATDCPDWTPTACQAKYRCRHRRLLKERPE